MTQVPPFSPSRSATRSDLVRDVIQDCFRRRTAGEQLPDDVLLAAHPELLPELASELDKLRQL